MINIAKENILMPNKSLHGIGRKLPRSREFRRKPVSLKIFTFTHFNNCGFREKLFWNTLTVPK